MFCLSIFINSYYYYSSYVLLPPGNVLRLSKDNISRFQSRIVLLPSYSVATTLEDDNENANNNNNTNNSSLSFYIINNNSNRNSTNRNSNSNANSSNNNSPRNSRDNNTPATTTITSSSIRRKKVEIIQQFRANTIQEREEWVSVLEKAIQREWEQREDIIGLWKKEDSMVYAIGIYRIIRIIISIPVY